MRSDRRPAGERAHPRRFAGALVAIALVVPAACSNDSRGAPLAAGDRLGVSVDSLTAAQRRARAGEIRDAARASGIEQGWLLAGIADAETNMSHCWSELTWACMGPNSDDCGGGPVVAGAADGPCSARQGGLGMFQFDAGDFDDTLAREGARILSISGNVAAAVDFVAAMVVRSTYVPDVADRAQAIAWMNGVRIDNARWDPWVRTVTHYYNGCTPTASCWTARYAHYRDRTADVHDEMGAAFWSEASDATDAGAARGDAGAPPDGAVRDGGARDAGRADGARVDAGTGGPNDAEPAGDERDGAIGDGAAIDSLDGAPGVHRRRALRGVTGGCAVARPVSDARGSWLFAALSLAVVVVSARRRVTIRCPSRCIARHRAR
jgi:hypothetical protein